MDVGFEKPTSPVDRWCYSGLSWAEDTHFGSPGKDSQPEVLCLQNPGRVPQGTASRAQQTMDRKPVGSSVFAIGRCAVSPCPESREDHRLQATPGPGAGAAADDASEHCSREFLGNRLSPPSAARPRSRREAEENHGRGRDGGEMAAVSGTGRDSTHCNDTAPRTAGSDLACMALRLGPREAPKPGLNAGTGKRESRAGEVPFGKYTHVVDA